MGKPRLLDVPRRGRARPARPSRRGRPARSWTSGGPDHRSAWLTRLLPALGEQLGDHTRPARLVAGPETRPVVAVKILVEERHAAPVWIALELLGAAEDGPAT